MGQNTTVVSGGSVNCENHVAFAGLALTTEIHIDASGPSRCTTSVRSTKVSSASARMRCRSSEGWKAKSKPASVLTVVRRPSVSAVLMRRLSRTVSSSTRNLSCRGPHPGAGRRVGGRHHGAVLCVRFLVPYFETETLMPFAIYCVVAGVAVLGWRSSSGPFRPDVPEATPCRRHHRL